MKKYLLTFLIFFLILSTAIIKNSTKRIDDKIFISKESIRDLKKDFANTKLENDYLSSTEKLIELQNLYFDEELVKKDIQDFKIMTKKIDELEIKPLKFINAK
tara:strand:- start:700 stop:1008 length:309 start_codon:yes stop_codon:yes gene_type:complete